MLFVVGVVAFWVVMNGQLVLREIDTRNQEVYQRGVSAYLGPQLRRERWMSIFRKNRKIGYTGLVFEKIFSDEGDEHKMTIETEITIDLFGRNLDSSSDSSSGEGKQIRIDGEVNTDVRMIPKTLAIDVQIGDGLFHLRGRRDGDRFLVRIESGNMQLFELPLPLKELSLTNGLTLDLPVSGFEVGQIFTVPVFNLILFQDSGVATVTVEEQTRRRTSSGLNVDCFRLSTKLQGQSSNSWVTADGEVLRQELPYLDVVLIQETREMARFLRRADRSRD